VAATGADGVILVRLLRVDDAGLDGDDAGTMMGPWGGFSDQASTAAASTPRESRNTMSRRWDQRLHGEQDAGWAATTQTVNPTTVAKEALRTTPISSSRNCARNLLPPAKS
jgi:hypothetical protein